MIGPDSGSTIISSMRMLDAPSTRAASYSSVGMEDCRKVRVMITL